MCPFFVLTFIFSLLLLIGEISSALIGVSFHPERLTLREGETQQVRIDLRLSSDAFGKNSPILGRYRLHSTSPSVGSLNSQPEQYFQVTEKDLRHNGTFATKYFDIKADFLGYTKVRLEKVDQGAVSVQAPDFELTVVRVKQFIQTMFIIAVAIVVSISYINMGCALDMNEVATTLRRPVGPAIGLFSQYVCMPLISYFLGRLLFSETYLQLGLFMFGCSPGGGASNMWAVLLGGNLNLSIAMTFLSTVLSFGAMPIWLYSLGRSIYSATTVRPPARSILSTLGSMLIFLGIGLFIKKYCPRTASVCRRILAPFSAAMIVFIIVFGTYSNWYMFKVMTWQMFLATALTVWSGMLIGGALAMMFGKKIEDVIAIAIETGVQNTGVSIVLLGVSLQQPDADLASAVPVSASIMTPIPLTIAYFFIKTRNYLRQPKKGILEPSSRSSSAEENQKFAYRDRIPSVEELYRSTSPTSDDTDYESCRNSSTERIQRA